MCGIARILGVDPATTGRVSTTWGVGAVDGTTRFSTSSSRSRARFRDMAGRVVFTPPVRLTHRWSRSERAFFDMVVCVLYRVRVPNEFGTNTDRALVDRGGWEPRPGLRPGTP